MRIKWIRKTHRWLGLAIGVQLLLWTVSGLYFSWNPIETVRGEHLTTAPETLAAGRAGRLASPSVVLDALRRREGEAVTVDAVRLRPLLGTPVYEVTYRAGDSVRYALADARTGAWRPPLRRREAVALARADFAPEAPVQSVERVEEAPPGAEYRGVTLPAYRVSFDHPTNTRLYVSAPRGRVMARRNDTWRLFDFMWMLHIMDYEARSDFNHWLLQGVSLLGVVTVLSGFLLWGVTSPLLRGRRKRKRPRRPARGTRPADPPPEAGGSTSQEVSSRDA